MTTWKINCFGIGGVAALLLLACATGCGDGRPTRVPIAGQVLIDGQPLTFGTIRFIPDNARMSSGELDSTGRFTLSCFDHSDGAVRGTHKVTVSAGQSISPNKVRWLAPKTYAELSTSDLKHTITDADDSVTINLTWNGGRPFVETIETEDDSSRLGR